MKKHSDALRADLRDYLSNAKDDTDLFSRIVNGPFRTLIQAELSIGTVVFLIDNKEKGEIERVALSATPSSEGAVLASAKPFNKITIPRDFEESAHVQALRSKNPITVSDWHDLFAPALSAEQARDNQRSAGIATSVVQPYFGKKTEGTIIFSLFIESSEMTDNHYEFFSWYADLVASLL